jgi:hypothetical protein
MVVLHGAIVLKRMYVGGATDSRTAKSATAEMSDGRHVQCKVMAGTNNVGVEFSQELHIREGEKLRLLFRSELT